MSPLQSDLDTAGEKGGIVNVRSKAPRRSGRDCDGIVLAPFVGCLGSRKRPSPSKGSLHSGSPLKGLSCACRLYASRTGQGFACVAPLALLVTIGGGFEAGTMGHCGSPAARVEKRDRAARKARLLNPQVGVTCYPRYAKATAGSVGVGRRKSPTAKAGESLTPSLWLHHRG